MRSSPFSESVDRRLPVSRPSPLLWSRLNVFDPRLSSSSLLPFPERPFTQKKNPLKNKAVLFSLNPYAASVKRASLKVQQKRLASKAAPKKA